ncbi:chemotaxis protein CheR [Geomonas sp. RF6]|uniref:CheR family methyltransferase n=1 Tax=Geomonas sp. RF6 TaxID=2897342 RepID=UPI001E3FCA67|nr:CheR family methyltransferase [Geomonas sp. RF6]UFS69416.1 chemotaxis protein CheR [Geomonas sp. RF6]
MATTLSDATLTRVSDFLGAQMGLHFPKQRWGDLERGLVEAAREMGFPDVAACAGRLVNQTLTQRQIEILASHLTVPETYFFREPASLQVVESVILPELVHERRGRDQRLRLWSAGCSSGEEAYTLAIMLYRMLPDLKEWHITILGTDISPRALHKARGGIYSNWSFRGTPNWLKDLFFRPAGAGRYELSQQIRQMVSFSYLNLARDDYPSLVTNTNAMDLILCRNVLMYFTQQLAQEVAERLHKSLMDGGWLLVSPAEVSPQTFSSFQGVNFPDATVYRKSADSVPARSVEAPASIATPFPAGNGGAEGGSLPLHAAEDSLAAAGDAFRAGRYGEAAAALQELLQDGRRDAHGYSLIVRSFANQGALDQALHWCERAITVHKLTAEFHYLRAVILQEKDEMQEARLSLQRALYLDPNLVLAHFALGKIAMGEGKGKAAKHFHNALALLKGMAPDDTLPESEGMTAARLKEVIHSLLGR